MNGRAQKWIALPRVLTARASPPPHPVQVLCMHGGIGRSINSIEQIEELQRPLTMEDGGIGGWGGARMQWLCAGHGRMGTAGWAPVLCEGATPPHTTRPSCPLRTHPALVSQQPAHAHRCPTAPPPPPAVLMDLLWSDPTTNDAVEGVQPSPRGPGLVTFGPDRVMEFCQVGAQIQRV